MCTFHVDANFVLVLAFPSNVIPSHLKTHRRKPCLQTLKNLNKKEKEDGKKCFFKKILADGMHDAGSDHVVICLVLLPVFM